MQTPKETDRSKEKKSVQKKEAPKEISPRPNPNRRLSTMLEGSFKALGDEFPQYFFQPDSPFLQYWNFILMTAVVYISIFVPIRVGFTIPTEKPEQILDVLLDFFFLVDMSFNFRTAYIDNNTKVVIHDPQLVARRYLTGWFTMDLFSSLPIAIMSLIDESVENLTFFKIFRFLKIFRITRLMRLEFVRDLEYKGILAPSFVRMMKFLVIFMFSLHIITCFFWLVFSREVPESDSLTGEEPAGRWGDIDRSEINGSLSRRYTLGLYWSLVVSLGNDFSPEDMTQRIFSICILVAGIFLYAIIVGSASSLMTNLDHNAAMKKRQMDDVNYYMMFHRVPVGLQEKVRNYYEYQWSQGMGGQEERHLFHSLSEKWRTRLQMAVKAKFVQGVPIFSTMTPLCVEAMVLKLKTFISLPSEAVVTQGKEGRECFFINRGTVQVVLSQKCDETGELEHVKLSQMNTGAYFGEIALLDRSNPIRTVSVVSVTYCNFFILDLNCYETVMGEFPEMEVAMKEEVERRKRKSDIATKHIVKMQKKESDRRRTVMETSGRQASTKDKWPSMQPMVEEELSTTSPQSSLKEQPELMAEIDKVSKVAPVGPPSN